MFEKEIVDTQAFPATMQKVIELVNHLRRLDVKIGTTEVLDSANGVLAGPFTNDEDMRTVLKLTLIKNPNDFQLFDYLFDTLWNKREIPTNPAENEKKQNAAPFEGPRLKDAQRKTEPKLASSPDFTNMESIPQDEIKTASKAAIYSPMERRSRKQFSPISREVFNDTKKVMKKFRRRLATRPGRKYFASVKGELDLWRTLRRSLTSGGEFTKLLRRKKRIMISKIVVLCDVSGSMDSHIESLMHLFYAMRSAIRSSEFFLFSTELVRVTEILNPSDSRNLQKLAHRVSIWGSGTKIGYCLKLFNERYIVDSKTALILISDGWDVGDTNLLRRELIRIKRRAGYLIWLNPLLDVPGYKPVCVGMQTALPLVDVFATTRLLQEKRVFEKIIGSGLRPLSKEEKIVTFGNST